MFENCVWKLLILEIYIIIQIDILEKYDTLWIKVIVIKMFLNCKKKRITHMQYIFEKCLFFDGFIAILTLWLENDLKLYFQ